MIATFACLTTFPLQQNAGFTYREYEADKIKPTEFAQRRREIELRLPKGNVTVLVTNPLQARNADCDFRFRPNSYFWYLTGCEEEDSALILAPDGITVDGKNVKEILFVRDKNPGSDLGRGSLWDQRSRKRLLGSKWYFRTGGSLRFLRRPGPPR